MILKKFIPLLLVVICAAACKPKTMDAAKLYGKWKYIKVENPNATPPDSVPTYRIQEDQPYIELKQTDSLKIVWGGKVLSHGKFKVTGNNIDYTETLGKGQTREFPFIVSKLTDKDIVFETNGDDGSRVTAVRERP